MHVLLLSLQTLTRASRACGEDAVWLPGLHLHLTMWTLFSVSRDNLICTLVEENKVGVPVAGGGGGPCLY